MIPMTTNFARAAAPINAAPLAVAVLTNAWGQYLWADRRPSDAMLAQGDPILADGSVLADGSAATSLNELLGWSARVQAWGAIRESLEPRGDSLLAGLAQAETPSYSLTVDAGDGEPARLLAAENLLGAALEIRVGFPVLAAHEFARRFRGTVTRVVLRRDQCTVEAEAL